MNFLTFMKLGRALLLSAVLAVGAVWLAGCEESSSLDGVWVRSDGRRIAVNGSTGVVRAFGTPTVLGQSAIDRGYWKLGDAYWRNLTSTDNITWTGEADGILFDSSNPNVATGRSWTSVTLTLSDDKQTLTEYAVYGTGTKYDIWTRE